MAIIFENQFVKYVIGEDGSNLGFIGKANGIDHVVDGSCQRCAQVKQGSLIHNASAAAYDDGRLTVQFGQARVNAVIRVAIHQDYFVFEVESVSGDLDELVFINIPTSLKAMPDEPFSAGVLALDLQTNVEELPGPQQHLWAACYHRFGFPGARAGLVACPYERMRDVLKKMVGDALGVPNSPVGGPWAMDSQLPLGSYMCGAPTEQTVDAWIDLCRATGVTQVQFNECLRFGDCQPFPALYPNSHSSVKAVVDKLHAAGILAGLHTLSFAIDKCSVLVTPVPDPRLAKEKSYILAKAIDADDDALALVEATDDLPRHVNYFIRRSMTLQIDGELIAYSMVDATHHRLAGCLRGACGTKPAPHAKGAMVQHLKECWGCFLPDGDSTLFGEVASRIAMAVNECGFDFIYLDGLDGAHVLGGEENRWHYGAKFAFEVHGRLNRPTLMEMATFHHHLWFTRSRMQTWDCSIRGHRKFIDIHCESNEGCRRIFMPRHLGVVVMPAWGNQECDVMFDDDVEYIWGKALATDAGFCLARLSPETYANEPLLRRMVPIIKAYEDLRLQNHFPETIKGKLREPGMEFTLGRDKGGEWEFQPIQVARHKVEGLDGVTNRWCVDNQFGRQEPHLRIHALLSASSYDALDNIVLADFQSMGEFADRGVTEVILNSGKLYSYPAAAPGMKADIRPSTIQFKAGGGGCWTVSNAGSCETVCSSAPGDAYSLLDHAERAFQPQQASWVRLGKIYPLPVDLDKHQGMGVWICGDGGGELLNLQLCSPKHFNAHADHYVTVDFTGWRYFELIEPESERFEAHSWPYGRCAYSQYREGLGFKCVERLNLWCNDVAVGRTATCHLSPIKALPLVKNKVSRPSITVSGRTVVFPVEIESGCYLEFRGVNDCKLYDQKGELMQHVIPEGGIPMLELGANEIVFQCGESAIRPRTNVTVIARRGGG